MGTEVIHRNQSILCIPLTTSKEFSERKGVSLLGESCLICHLFQFTNCKLLLPIIHSHGGVSIYNLSFIVMVVYLFITYHS